LKATKFRASMRPEINRGQSVWGSLTLTRSIGLLSTRDRRIILVAALIQSIIGVLDLLGVLVIGILGALSVSGLQGANQDSRIDAVLTLMGLSDYEFQTQALILGVIATFLLVGRTVFSIFFTRRILFFFSRRGAKISADLIARLLAQPFLAIQARTTQEILYSVTRGVELVSLQILAPGVVLISDISLLLIMGVGLFIVSPATAISTMLIFGLIGFLLYYFMHSRAGFLGSVSSDFSIKSNEKIVEVFGSYRESIVRNRRRYYAREIGELRYGLANAQAEISFLPYIGKYVIETTVVISAMLIGAIQFILQDAVHAVSTLALFLAAGTRIAPSVLRLQQGTIQIRSSLGMAKPTLDLIDNLGRLPLSRDAEDEIDFIHEGFNGSLKIDSVSFAYPNNETPTLRNISLSIPVGSSVAIVGPSGAGKTTLVDILLGVLTPDTGEVRISGLAPHAAITRWPGAVAYVPQDVLIVSGSIRENISLGYPLEVATDDLVMKTLRVSRLDHFVALLPRGIDTQVGERGTHISGGQRQRLGIARAMFTRPQVLVLDEATSSLDGETEANISQALNDLRGEITVVMIAHRLSTVKNADLVVYLADGQALAVGTFEEVRSLVPAFNNQAKLMGL
jgi:ABC-type multidrug transport system fused ATPase/permease subunit